MNKQIKIAFKYQNRIAIIFNLNFKPHLKISRLCKK